nr:MAG TPA: hypothetical protein [Caudoviricetes sp.]
MSCPPNTARCLRTTYRSTENKFRAVQPLPLYQRDEYRMHPLRFFLLQFSPMYHHIILLAQHQMSIKRYNYLHK